MTLEECIDYAEEQSKWMSKYSMIDIYKERSEYYQDLAEWLRELKTYRRILANADRIIESEYGCVIIEGYKDVIDQMNEVFRGGKS